VKRGAGRAVIDSGCSEIERGLIIRVDGRHNRRRMKV
jgi:hypothetical protein